MGGKKGGEGKRERPKTPVRREGEPHSKLQKVLTPQKTPHNKAQQHQQQQQGKNLQVKQENNVGVCKYVEYLMIMRCMLKKFKRMLMLF